MSDNTIDGWITVYKCGKDYEAELVRDRLIDAGLSAVVLTHRDRAFNLNIGDLSTVRVLVSPSQEEAATRLLHTAPLSNEDLEAAALAADPKVDDDGPD